MSFLDETGLSYFWSKLKQKFSDLSDGVNKNFHFTPEYGKTNFIQNLMLINTDGSMQNAWMYDGSVATEDASSLVGSPVTSGPFYADRRVKVIRAGGSNVKVLVELKEMYPVGGRLWYAVYDGNQSNWITPWMCQYPASDDIIDQGTSGVWSYRKYRGGTAECWCTRYIGGQAFSNHWGGLYITADNVVSQMAYPFSFAGGTIPSELLTVQTAFAGAVFLINGTSRNSNSHTGSYTPASASNTIKDFNVSYHVIGRWK